MAIKWVVLDAMGVIFTVGRDLYELLIPFIWSKNERVSERLMIKTYVEASYGRYSSFKLWKRLGFGDQYPEIEKEYLDKQLTIDQEFLELSSEFKKKYKMALLSNDVSEWSSYLRKKFGLNDIFDEIIISGDVGLRKPNLKIFRLLLNKIKAKPEEVVFVDDNLHNIKAASELGIYTLRFVREKEKIPFCSEFEVRNFSELLNVLNHFF